MTGPLSAGSFLSHARQGRGSHERPG
jgi:hypothetical protein